MSFSEIKSQNDSSNIFKGLEAIVALAPYTADPIDGIVDSATKEIKDLPEGYEPVGMITEDGVTFSGDSSEEEVRALGYVSAVRKDTTEASREVTFSALEVLRKSLLHIVHGVDEAAVTTTAAGETKISVPELPQHKHYRLLVIAKDSTTDTYQARFFPKVKLASVPETVWSAADAETFELTFNAETDSALGTSMDIYTVTKTA